MRQHTRSTSSGGPPQELIPSYAPGPPGSIQGPGGKRSMPPHPAESPAKKQSKWSAEEDALIIDLRGGGMKWEDISKRLPGRSAISCRLHYQNYLERRSEWDEERKNKLARLYERFKPEMWSKVAEEMAVPWRAAEAMHWQLGEQDMARRAGVVPFSLSSVTVDTPPPGHRSSPSRGHAHSQSQSSSSSRYTGRPPSVSSHPQPPPMGMSHQRGNSINTRTLAARRESTPRSVPPTSPSENLTLAGMGRGMGMQTGLQMLPSVAEMTTGVSPYTTPAYAMSMPMGGGYPSPGPLLPAIGMMGVSPRPEGQRRGSPDYETRDPNRRR